MLLTGLDVVAVGTRIRFTASNSDLKTDAAITTDAGLGHEELPLDWALLSPGNVNLQALNNLGSKSLDEQVGREEQMFSVMILRILSY